MQLIRRLRRIALRQFVGPAFLVLVSLFVGGLIGEVMIRLVAPQIFPIHPPGMYVEDPDLGYVLSPGFSGVLERPEFRDTIEIGEFGFRGASPRAKGENSLTVLVLGDSQAFGFGTAEDETYSVLLEQMLAAAHPGTDVQVLNGGVPGYGTADQLALLESRGPAVDPDLVIVTFLSVNDLVENLTPASTWARVEDGMLGSREGATKTELPLRRRFEMWIKRQSHLVSLVSNSAGYWMVRLGLVGQQGAMWGEDFSADQAELGTDLLVRIAAAADSMGAATLFLYTTGQASVIQADYEVLPSRAVVAAAADRAGVPWIDVTERQRALPNPAALYYPGNGHWTADGHRTVAEIVAGDLPPLALDAE